MSKAETAAYIREWHEKHKDQVPALLAASKRESSMNTTRVGADEAGNDVMLVERMAQQSGATFVSPYRGKKFRIGGAVQVTAANGHAIASAVEDQQLDRLDRALARAAVAALGPEDRQLVELWRQGLSRAEIARRTNLDERTLGRRLDAAVALAQHNLLLLRKGRRNGVSCGAYIEGTPSLATPPMALPTDPRRMSLLNAIAELDRCRAAIPDAPDLQADLALTIQRLTAQLHGSQSAIPDWQGEASLPPHLRSNRRKPARKPK